MKELQESKIHTEATISIDQSKVRTSAGRKELIDRIQIIWNVFPIRRV
jgi:hypothetical protein